MSFEQKVAENSAVFEVNQISSTWDLQGAKVGFGDVCILTYTPAGHKLRTYDHNGCKREFKWKLRGTSVRTRKIRRASCSFYICKITGNSRP